MDKTFEMMLTGGHPNSLGRTVEVVDLVLAEASSWWRRAVCPHLANGTPTPDRLLLTVRDTVRMVPVTGSVPTYTHTRQGLFPPFPRLPRTTGTVTPALSQLAKVGQLASGHEPGGVSDPP